MTPSAKSATLKVPGAAIYYEIQGSGPILLMIPGGPTDAGVFADLSRHLADRYTVVAYDPRGNSRSLFNDAVEEQSLDIHGDDAARLIEALGDEAVYVFGTSGGAQIGLNLAARHPERVRALVAHEPPCYRLLPDTAAVMASSQDVYETYCRDGVGPAMQKFMAANGLTRGPPRDGAAPKVAPTPEADATFTRMNGNMSYFLAHGLRPISSYLPDIAALRAGPVSVVVGVGESTVGQTAHRTAVALAEQLGIGPVVFPGDHGGYGPHAAAFADVLHHVLTCE